MITIVDYGLGNVLAIANIYTRLGIGVRTLCGKLRQYGYAPRTKAFSKAG